MALTGMIGQYRVEKRLGAGAMGQVYLAVDTRMYDRKVALKILSEQLSENTHARQRFSKEVETAAGLTHPNIVTIYDHGEHEARPYFTMEYLDGHDLSHYNENQAEKNLAWRLDIACQIGHALSCAHEMQIIHRDVKPGNIMVVNKAERDVAKLLDFGIVHVEQSQLTTAHSQPGTFAFMSPEQLRSDPIDTRSDLFSMGIVLFELFTGAHPFHAKNDLLISNRILIGDMDPPRPRAGELPGSITSLLMKLLEPDPNKRPATAGDVASTLEELARRQHAPRVEDPDRSLSELTGPMLEKLLAMASKKEAAGELQEAADAYDRAQSISPDDPYVRQLKERLAHRIQSEKKLKEHLDSARSDLEAGRHQRARSNWRQAWILSPDNREVTDLERRIEQAESSATVRLGDQRSVRKRLDEANEALRLGDLAAARAALVEVVRGDPNNHQARTLLDRTMEIVARGIDYGAFCSAVNDARAAAAAGRFDLALQHSSRARDIWPSDEVTIVEREIYAGRFQQVEELVEEADRHLADAAASGTTDARFQELVNSVSATLQRLAEMGSEKKRASLKQRLEKMQQTVAARRQAEYDAKVLELSAKATQRVERALQCRRAPPGRWKDVERRFESAQSAIADLLELDSSPEWEDRRRELNRELDELRAEREERERRLAAEKREREEQERRLAAEKKTREKEERRLAAEKKEREEQERRLAAEKEEREEKERRLAAGKKEREEQQRRAAAEKKERENEERRRAKAAEKKEREEKRRRLAAERKEREEQEQRLAKATEDRQPRTRKIDESPKPGAPWRNIAIAAGLVVVLLVAGFIIWPRMRGDSTTIVEQTEPAPPKPVAPLPDPADNGPDPDERLEAAGEQIDSAAEESDSLLLRQASSKLLEAGRNCCGDPSRLGGVHRLLEEAEQLAGEAADQNAPEMDQIRKQLGARQAELSKATAGIRSDGERLLRSARNPTALSPEEAAKATDGIRDVLVSYGYLVDTALGKPGDSARRNDLRSTLDKLEAAGSERSSELNRARAGADDWLARTASTLTDDLTPSAIRGRIAEGQEIQAGLTPFGGALQTSKAAIDGRIEVIEEIYRDRWEEARENATRSLDRADEAGTEVELRAAADEIRASRSTVEQFPADQDPTLLTELGAMEEKLADHLRELEQNATQTQNEGAATEAISTRMAELEQALETFDVGGLVRLAPCREEEADRFEGYSSGSYTMRCHAAVLSADGNSASVECDETLSWKKDEYPGVYTYRLEQSAGVWHIVDCSGVFD